MPRKAKKKKASERVPRTRAGGTMTEAQFWSFIRSNLRKMSKRWPPVNDIWKTDRRPNQDASQPRVKWQHQCVDCEDWFARKEMDADHEIPCGRLTDWSHIPGFIARLLVEPPGIAKRCKGCHKAKTARERAKLRKFNESNRARASAAATSEG